MKKWIRLKSKSRTIEQVCEICNRIHRNIADGRFCKSLQIPVIVDSFIRCQNTQCKKWIRLDPITKREREQWGRNLPLLPIEPEMYRLSTMLVNKTKWVCWDCWDTNDKILRKE